MERQDQEKGFFSQWTELQKSFFNHWADSFSKMYQPWMDPMRFWQGMNTPSPSLDLFSKWSQMLWKTIGKDSEQIEESLGMTAFSRILRASNVFVILNEFWMEVLKDLPELYRAKDADVKSREIFERWVNRYERVFEQLVGPPFSKTAQEIMASWLNILQMNQAAIGLMWNPWIQATPQWREQAERFMKGDWATLTEGRSLWREVYDETLGRVFRMPAFGLTKEQTERLRRAYDAFGQYLYSLPNFYQFFYNAGMEALKEVFEKMKELKFEEMTPETAREIYKIWVTSNENTFFELFKSPEFSNAMGEVLNHALRLKQRLDDLTAEWCEAFSIPSNRELDAVAMAVQELRRKVHMQQNAIEALQRKLDKIA